MDATGFVRSKGHRQPVDHVLGIKTPQKLDINLNFWGAVQNEGVSINSVVARDEIDQGLRMANPLPI